MNNIIELKKYPQVEKIRSQIIAGASILLHIPLWIARLIGDSRTPKNVRSRLIFTSAYIILPISLLSRKKWGVVGYLDDLILALTSLKFVFEHVTPAMVLEHWRGSKKELLKFKEWVYFLEDLPSQIPTILKDFRKGS